MGLDISVNVTASDVLRDLEYEDDRIGLSDVAKAILAKMPPGETIATRTGSYGGLHVLRDAFVKLKDLPPESHTVPDAHTPYHLLNHCDAEGWYLPNDFEKPIWADGTSIGSSVRLLAELEELYPVAKDSDWLWRWDALYVAAVASVISRQPIKFH